jgi:hypothetical protein
MYFNNLKKKQLQLHFQTVIAYYLRCGKISSNSHCWRKKFVIVYFHEIYAIRRNCQVVSKSIAI